MSQPFLIADSVLGLKHDRLHFDRYASPLLKLFADPFAETPFTVGIFGTWGSGKSTLLKILDERLQTEYPGKFLRVHFNPWYYRREPTMLVPLLHTLRDTLEEEPGGKFLESARKIAEVLLRLGADVLLKAVTVDKVSLENLEKLEQKYLEEHSKVQSQTRKLHAVLQENINAVAKLGTQTIIFIDDLDRCEPDEIIDLLETIKLFFDLDNVFILLAVDKEVIDRGIEIKYGKFQFSPERKQALGSEYLEKMVQLPMYLFPLQAAQVRFFIESLDSTGKFRQQLDLLQHLLLPNPRKIKRVLNILSVTAEMMDRTPGLHSLKVDVLARLIVLQVQANDLYSEVVRHTDVLLALDDVYAQKKSVDKQLDFRDFGDRGEAVRNLCLKFYRPESILASLFKDSPFSQITPEEWPQYLSLVGI